MKWQTGTPTKNGYYWIRYRTDSKYDWIGGMCRIHGDDMYSFGSDCPVSAKRIFGMEPPFEAQWMGPIEVPEFTA